MDTVTASKLPSARAMRNASSAGLIAVLMALCIAVPAAQAAEYTYANKQMTASGTARDSGSKPVIRGSSAQSDVAVGEVRTTIYHPYPGYREVSSVTVSYGGVARTSYPAGATNAHSKCVWYVNVGGSAALTCKYSN